MKQLDIQDLADQIMSTLSPPLSPFVTVKREAVARAYAERVGPSYAQDLVRELDATRVHLSAIEAKDTPWPLRDVLMYLANSASHLLRDHDCDVHGYELVAQARDAALNIIRELDALSRK